MASRHHLPAGYTISASIFDGDGFIRNAAEPREGSIVTNARAVSFGPYPIAHDFIVTGDCTVVVDVADIPGPIVADLDPNGTAAANGAVLGAAIAAASRTGVTVKIPAGRYKMACSTTYGATIEFDPEACFLQGANAYCLDFDHSGDAVGPYAVTSLTLAENAASSGAASNKFLKVTLTTAGDSANFTAGDAVLISSQDARTYYTTNTNYAGEMAFVASVEAGILYLNTSGYLTSVFSTSIVVRRLTRTKRIRLIRPQVETDGSAFTTGLAGSWPGSIQIKAANHPVIENLRINSAWGIGLYFKTSAAFKVTIDHIKDCLGDPANNRFGYGILARGACNNGSISGGHIERCRHGITTDCREAAAWDVANIWDHGDCTDMVVTGVYAIAHGAPPFDTHENSVGTKYIGCTAHGARYSPLGITGATGNGFNLRGPWDSVLNCRAIHCEGGVNVAATGLVHELSGTNIIDGFEFIGEATNNLASYGITIAGDSDETTQQRVCIRNLRPGVGTRGVIVEAEHAGRVLFQNCTFMGWVDTVVRIQGTGTYDFVGNLFDMTEGGASELIISVDNSNTAAINLVNNAFRSRASSSATVVVTTASGATSNIRHGGNYEVNASNISSGISGGAGTNNETAITALA